MRSMSDCSQHPPPHSAAIIGSFAYDTINERLPKILAETIDRLSRSRAEITGPEDSETHKDRDRELKSILAHLGRLRYELMTNKPLRPLVDDGVGDVAQWQQAYEQEGCKLEGGEPLWYSSPWLYLECYMYRAIHGIIRHRTTDMEPVAHTTYLSSYDPFSHQKKEAFCTSLPAISLLLTYLDNAATSSMDFEKKKELVQNMFELSLWGNKCDLSISAGGANSQISNPIDQLEKLRPYILVDDFDILWYTVMEKISKENGANVSIVLDNAGFELITDLCLAEALLITGVATSITLHAKVMPWFVSDVTPSDFEWTINELEKSTDPVLKKYGDRWCRRIGSRSELLPSHKHAGQSTEQYSSGDDLLSRSFVLTSDKFWTLPYDFSRMSEIAPELYAALSKSSLVVFKGDLNYRKLVGDLQWVPWDGFSEALRGFGPAPLVALRTTKADLILGLTKERLAEVDGEEEAVTVRVSGDGGESKEKYRKWIVSGKYGVVQSHC